MNKLATFWDERPTYQKALIVVGGVAAVGVAIASITYVAPAIAAAISKRGFIAAVGRSGMLLAGGRAAEELAKGVRFAA